MVVELHPGRGQASPFCRIPWNTWCPRFGVEDGLARTPDGLDLIARHLGVSARLVRQIVAKVSAGENIDDPLVDQIYCLISDTIRLAVKDEKIEGRM
jgi:hypothetical protein